MPPEPQGEAAVTPEVAAVIVNYNAGPELRHALSALAADLAGRRWEGMVVDNASVDGSSDAAREFADVRVVRNAENVGFGRGVNQGVAAVTAPLILIVNPDCRLAAGACALSIDTIERATAGYCVSEPGASALGEAGAGLSAGSPALCA